MDYLWFTKKCFEQKIDIIMRLHSFNITNFKIDGGTMFGVVPKAIWSRKYPSDENNLCNCAIRTLLIEEGDKKILIDTGYGNKQNEKFFSHVHLNGGEGLVEGLANRGIKPEEITDVIITHMHTDHCGGCVIKDEKNGEYKLLFENANHWVSREHWEWAINPNYREADAFLKENIMPIYESGKLKYANENTVISESISIKIYNGHTLGQIIPYIKYKDKTIIFCADQFPSLAHIPIKYMAAFDVYPMEMLKEKMAIIEDALKNDYILFFQHDAYVECASLQMTEKGIKEKETFTIADL